MTDERITQRLDQPQPEITIAQRIARVYAREAYKAAIAAATETHRIYRAHDQESPIVLADDATAAAAQQILSYTDEYRNDSRTEQRKTIARVAAAATYEANLDPTTRRRSDYPHPYTEEEISEHAQAAAAHGIYQGPIADEDDAPPAEPDDEQRAAAAADRAHDAARVLRLIRAAAEENADITHDPHATRTIEDQYRLGLTDAAIAEQHLARIRACSAHKHPDAAALAEAAADRAHASAQAAQDAFDRAANTPSSAHA